MLVFPIAMLIRATSYGAPAILSYTGPTDLASR